MRLIRNLLLLTFVGIAVVAAYAWTDRSRLREKAVDYAAETAKREAVEGASRVAEKAGETVDTVGDKISDGALTAKIKSKMALDDHVNARAIDVEVGSR